MASSSLQLLRMEEMMSTDGRDFLSCSKLRILSSFWCTEVSYSGKETGGSVAMLSVVDSVLTRLTGVSW